MLAVVSIAMWAIIAVAYKEVTHAYHAEALEIPQSQVLLLMGSSMVGSVIQLPGVGGGSQLATIAALEHIFDVPRELAASCGIMLWLVTFVAVIPVGLLLAHRERLSLRKLSKESHQKEEEAEVGASCRVKYCGASDLSWRQTSAWSAESEIRGLMSEVRGPMRSPPVTIASEDSRLT